jgi:hypothetical protein
MAAPMVVTVAAEVLVATVAVAAVITAAEVMVVAAAPIAAAGAEARMAAEVTRTKTGFETRARPEFPGGLFVLQATLPYGSFPADLQQAVLCLFLAVTTLFCRGC